MNNIFDNWLSISQFKITDKMLNAVMVKDNSVDEECREVGALAEIIKNKIFNSDKTSKLADYSSIDSFQITSQGLVKDQIKGYVLIPENLYVGCSKRQHAIIEQAKTLLKKNGSYLPEQSIEELFEDKKFFNKFQNIIAPAIKYNNIIHIAIDKNKDLFKVLDMFSRDWVLDNCNLFRIKHFNGGKDFLMDRKISIDKHRGEQNGNNSNKQP